MTDFLTVSVDAREILTYSNTFKGRITGHLRVAASRIQAEGPRLIAGAARNVGLYAGEFPPAYVYHIQEVALTTSVYTQIVGTSIEAGYDFGQLGDWDDLEPAFHRHAKLADGTQLEGPYVGQELKNPIEVRYDAWIRFADQEKSFEEKVAIWGDKAPEWLYLQYGQIYQPYSPPTNFMETAMNSLYKLVYSSTANAVKAAAENTAYTNSIISSEGEVFANLSEQAQARQRRRTGQFSFGYKPINER